MSKLADIEQAIQPLIQAFTGEVAIGFKHFTQGDSYGYKSEKVMRSASLIKLPILMYALSEVAKGHVSLKQRIPLKEDDLVSGAGILYALQANLEPSVQDLLTLMIIVSDNTATNMLIDLLDVNAINQHMQSLGMKNSKLIGKLQIPTEKRNAAQKRGENNTTSVNDLMTLYNTLLQGELPQALSDLAIDILKKQHYTEAMSRYLPTDAELTSPYVDVASKSGCLRGLWHDSGIVFKDDLPLYCLVVMTDHSQDTSYGWEQEGMMLIAKISKTIFDLYQA